MAEQSFLETLKQSIKTSAASAKARAAGDWFKEKVRQASASAQMRAVTPNQLLRRQEEGSVGMARRRREHSDR